MAPFLITLVLQAALASAVQASTSASQAQPASAAGPAKGADTNPPPSIADTLAGLEETYRVSCGQTGILYYGYAELCDSLRKQIAEYRKKVEREAQAAAKAPPKP